MSTTEPDNNPDLSICIATYDREVLVIPLVESLLEEDGEFEVCVHVDGSRDNSFSRLSAVTTPRLKVSRSENLGRPSALQSLICNASGRFLLFMDDDDTLSAAGLREILGDCKAAIPASECGFVYLLADESGNTIGTRFPVSSANFLALRADHAVIGDKREVVRTELVRHHLEIFEGGYRRVPTSLLWSKIALEYDVGCSNVVVGQKAYKPDGMTATAGRLKTENPWPMVRLYTVILTGRLRSRYKSNRFAARALAACLYYSVLAARNWLLSNRA